MNNADGNIAAVRASRLHVNRLSHGEMGCTVPFVQFSREQ